MTQPVFEKIAAGLIEVLHVTGLESSETGLSQAYDDAILFGTGFVAVTIGKHGFAKYERLAPDRIMVAVPEGPTP